MSGVAIDGFVIRPLVIDDVPLIVTWRSRPEVHEWYGGRPVTEDEILVRHIHSTEPVTRCIVEMDGEPIGFLQYYRYIREWKPAVGLRKSEDAWGIDLFIGEPHLHGTGIGSRLVRGVAEFLADEHDATRVLIDPHVGNVRAVRAYEKAGFRKLRVLPSYEQIGDRWHDAWLMEWTPPT
jgi:aminoglycoside 6'-N-acetyltransferase